MAIKPLLRTLHADLFSGGERGKLVRSASATAGLKVGNVVIAFLASLLFARILGPHDYGLYAYVIACTQVLIIPSSLGLSSYLVREGAKSPDSLPWLRRWADARTWAAGLIAAVLLTCAWFIPAAAGARVLFLIAAPLPLLTNLSSVRKALVQAHGWVARSLWPQLLLTPGMTLLAIAALWSIRGRFTAEELMAVTVATMLLAVAANAGQLRLATRDTTAARPVPVWLKAALPFMWLNGMYLINSRVDVIILGGLRGAREAGIYAVAVRAAELVPFFMTVAHLTLAPKISRLYHSGEHAQLQRLTSATAMRVLLATLPPALILLVAAQFLLNALYGSAFADGAMVIRILTVAQLVYVVAGPVGVLLNMTAHASLSAKSFTLGAVVNVALNLLLIPTLGMAGSALATGASLVLSNGVRWYMVRRHLRISPSCFGI